MFLAVLVSFIIVFARVHALQYPRV